MEDRSPMDLYDTQGKYKTHRGAANWIVGGVTLTVLFLLKMLFPEMDTRRALLIALCAAVAASVAIVLIKKRRMEQAACVEEEENAPQRETEPNDESKQ